MIKNLLDNWKTTSAGLSSITTGIIRLYLAIKHGTVDETVLTGAIGLIIVGIGLLAAGDASKSKMDTIAVDTKVDQTTAAIISHDTTMLPKPTPVLLPPISVPPGPQP
jgi:hypothetical protein